MDSSFWVLFGCYAKNINTHRRSLHSNKGRHKAALRKFFTVYSARDMGFKSPVRLWVLPTVILYHKTGGLSRRYAIQKGGKAALRKFFTVYSAMDMGFKSPVRLQLFL